MDYNKLQDYFELYVEKYAPYYDQDTHIAITKYLKNYYFKDSYCTIPNNLKLLVENSIISSDIYDVILKSDGYPSDLLVSLTNSDKQILIKSCYDYRRYSGTIYHIKKITSLFNNSVNVYELWIDYKNGVWCFCPKLVAKHSTVENEDILNYRLDYDYVYSRAKKFYISKHELQILYDNNQLILPFKTNILLLDYFENYTTTTVIDHLITTTTISSFSNYKIPILLNIHGNNNLSSCEILAINDIFANKSQTFTITVLSWFQLYYYIIFKYYNQQFNTLPLIDINLLVPSDNFYHNVTDLHSLIDEYNNIDSSNDAIEFFRNNIRDIFLTSKTTNYISNPSDIRMLLSLSNDIPKELLSYIDNIFESNVNLQSNIIDLLLSLKYSFITFKNNINDEVEQLYLNKVLETLSNLTILVKNTPNYALINEFKPFHTQLMDSTHIKIVSNDKMNVVTPSIYYCADVYAEAVSSSVLSDNSFDIVNITNADNINIIDANDININITDTDNINIDASSVYYYVDAYIEAVSSSVLSDDSFVTVSIADVDNINIMTNNSQPTIT